MQRLLCLLACLTGCGSAHVARDADAGPVPSADAAPRPDAALRADAGSAPDLSVGVASCALEAFEGGGEGCFCEGPVAAYGDTLYRQALGIEVWDVRTPSAPERVGTVDERPGSQGGLAVVGGVLVSLLDFDEDEDLRVYDLSDPHAPEVVGGLLLPPGANEGLAVHGDDLLVLRRDVDGSVVVRVDLSDPRRPVVRWTSPVDGAPQSVAASDDGVFVALETEGSDRRPMLLWLDAEGALIDRVEVAGRAFGRGLATLPGEVLLTGGDEVAVRRYRLEGRRLVAADVLPSDDEWSRGGALIPFAEAMFVLAAPLSVVHSGAPLRSLGRIDSPIGDAHHVASLGDGQWFFASGGNGFIPIRITCE